MGAQSDYYNSFYRELARIDGLHNSVKKIEKIMPELPPGARVIDIGCGHGLVGAGLVERGYDVSGMEINREALDSLRQKGIRAIEHDITQPFRLSETFDLVLVLDVLEHVFDPFSLLQEAAGLLSPGGHMIITVPLYFDLLDRLRILFTGSIVSYDNRCYGSDLYRRFRSYNYDHIRFFRPGDMFDLCRTVGLGVDKVHYGCFPAVFGPIGNLLVKLVSNRVTVGALPRLLAHSMVLRVMK